MSDLRKLAAVISMRSGYAATAVALTLSASAAFAEGNKEQGRHLVEQALAVQARVYDEPQDDTVLTADERAELREISESLRLSDEAFKKDYARLAAIDLLCTAGMISRHRADADASLRMVLAFNQEEPASKEEIRSVQRDMGFPIVIGLGRKNAIKFEGL